MCGWARTTKVIIIISIDIQGLRVSQKKCDPRLKWPQFHKNPSKTEKVGAFQKIQNKCCIIGTNFFKNFVETAERKIMNLKFLK